MSKNITAAAIKPASATKFAAVVIEGYLSPAFGARSKAETDLLIFAGLIEAGLVDPEAPLFDTARRLNISTTRVRNLLFNWQMRSPTPFDLRQAFAGALKKTRFSKDGTLLAFGVENPLLKEEIIASLKRKGFFADASFSKEIVRLPVEALVEFLDEILDDKTKEDVRVALVADKQLPDKSFKALAIGIFSKLGEKVAGEVGKEVAGELVGKVAKPITDKVVRFLTGLLAGDPGAAAKAISKDDFLDVA